MIKIELHCHTECSPDGFITEDQLIQQCKRKNVDCICITDHNNIKAVPKLQKLLRIIPGEEIRTSQGEIIGLFLTHEIPMGLSLKETVEQIKAQQGLVYLPHPFDKFRKSSVPLEAAEQISSLIDIVEVFNSRTFDNSCNLMAKAFADKYNLITAVGSDAHHRYEIASSYVIMNDFSDKHSFLRELRKATHFTRKCPFVLRLYIKALKLLSGKS